MNLVQKLRQRSIDELAAELSYAVRWNAPPSSYLIAVNEALAQSEAKANIARVRSFPIRVQIAITDICNARCTFCSYTPERVSSQPVSLEQLKRCDWLKFSRVLSLTAGLGD